SATELSPHPIDLHPFPTRRSSDLDHLVVQAVDKRCHVLADRLAEFLACKRLGRALVIAHVNEIGLNAKLGQEALVKRRFQMDARDRKSTRLNSSHLGTSYAVFCLK